MFNIAVTFKTKLQTALSAHQKLCAFNLLHIGGLHMLTFDLAKGLSAVYMDNGETLCGA